jgi:hypothetical protein
MPYMRMRPIVDQELGAGGAQELMNSVKLHIKHSWGCRF